VEVKSLTWTGDNLLWLVVYEGLREDKPAAEVRREMPRGSDRCIRRRDVIMHGKLECFNCIGLRLLAVRRPHRSQ